MTSPRDTRTWPLAGSARTVWRWAALASVISSACARGDETRRVEWPAPHPSQPARAASKPVEPSNTVEPAPAASAARVRPAELPAPAPPRGALERKPERQATAQPLDEPTRRALERVAKTIELLGERQRKIHRAEFISVVEAHHAELVAPLRFVPEAKDGEMIGFRLFGIRADNLGGLLGLSNGDRLEQVNDTPAVERGVTDEYLQMLRHAPEVTLHLSRRGQPTTLHYELR